MIEPGSEFRMLLYNRPSNCVVAQFLRLTEQQIGINDLYYRKSADSDYVRAANHEPRISYCDPVSCKGEPYVFFNIVEWDKGGTGYDWISVARLSLPDGKVVPLLSSDGLRLPDGCIRGWIASILDANEDGTVLTCRLALEFATQPHCSKVEYSVSDLNLATGEHKPLITLPGVFV